MAKQTVYEAAITYPAEPISLLDRNVARIAKNYSGSMCGDSFEYREACQHRRLAYSFEAKGKRNRIQCAMQKFIDRSDFGVTVIITPE